MNLLLLLVIVPLLRCETITGKIINSSYRQDSDIENLRVSLNYGDGSFQLQLRQQYESYNVESGKYIVQVHSNDYLYEQASIEVYYKGSQQKQAVQIQRLHPLTRKRPQSSDGVKISTASDLLVLHQIEKIAYFEPQDSISLASIYQNQYFFMIIMFVGLIFFMSKMPMDEIQNATRAPQVDK